MLSSINSQLTIDPTSLANESKWTFLTNHSHVLVCLLSHPEFTVRQMSSAIGITERAILRVMSDLEEAGVVTRVREGRRNRYALNLGVGLRHPMEAGHTAGELLDFIISKKD